MQGPERSGIARLFPGPAAQRDQHQLALRARARQCFGSTAFDKLVGLREGAVKLPAIKRLAVGQILGRTLGRTGQIGIGQQTHALPHMAVEDAAGTEQRFGHADAAFRQLTRREPERNAVCRGGSVFLQMAR